MRLFVGRSSKTDPPIDARQSQDVAAKKYLSLSKIYFKMFVSKSVTQNLQHSLRLILLNHLISFVAKERENSSNNLRVFNFISSIS